MSDGYRIECLDCGAVAFGDPDSNPAFDKEYHRERCRLDAEFEVAHD